MFEQEIVLNRFMLDYFDRLVEDISDDEFTQPMAGGGHSPQWIVGHLLTVGDSSGLFVGLTRSMPKATRRAFGPGSVEEVLDGDEFSRSSMIAQMRPTYERLQAAAREATDEEMQKPHNTGILAGSVIQTRGQIISHVLTTHIGTHLGQLSAWRRAQGRTPLL